MPYIENLALRHKVTVIVPYITDESRQMMGWGHYETHSPVSIMVTPSNEEVHTLLEEAYNGRTIAFFSGISAFKDVKRWFLMSLDYEIERAVITEAPYTFK